MPVYQDISLLSTLVSESMHYLAYSFTEKKGQLDSLMDNSAGLHVM